MIFLKKILPSFILSFARKVRIIFFDFIDKRKPYLNKMKYEGFDLYYARGEGLVNRIRFGNPDRLYERNVVLELKKMLSKSGQPVLLDVGANIGLISLAVLRRVPNVKIHAFEPGPHQQRLFATTIFANRLEDSIVLNGVAISDRNGVINFQVHDYKSSSGDGILDTQRAGNTKAVSVETITLDSWWIKNNQPRVDVVKIDVEGGELLVLRGMQDLINKCRPDIVLEISLLNIAVYPYQPQEYLSYFQLISYGLFTLDGQRCTNENFDEIIKSKDSFVAKPIL